MLLKTFGFGCVFTMYALVQVVVHKLARNPCKGHLRAVRVDSNGDEREWWNWKTVDLSWIYSPDQMQGWN